MTFTKAHILETERLLLLPVTPDIYNTVLRWYDDEDIKAFFGITTNEALLAEKERYRSGVATYNRSFVYYLLAEKVTEKIIGWCGFHTWYLLHNRAEIGYVMYDENQMRKGLMKEAIAPVLQVGFEEMKLKRVEALIAEENTASYKLLAGTGFTKEGVLRGHYCVNGINEDSVIYSLLKEEWEKTL